MSISVNRIPSISVPLTDKEGRISPVWHEFLRQFVAATTSATAAAAGDAVAVTAGNGLTGGGELSNDITLTVGAGSGIAVNADDVSVDIAGQAQVQAALDDEVLLSKVSDNNAIRKTKVRSLIELSSPGGSNTHVQYNDAGIYGGNSGFTYDGAGGIGGISSITTPSNLSINNGTTGHIVITGTQQVIRNGSGSATTRCIDFSGNSVVIYGLSSTSFISTTSTGFSIQPSSGKTATFTSSGIAIGGISLSMTDTPILRSLSATVSASTTQTQGQGPLTRDYNNVTTVTNANDVVTLPSPSPAQYCLVRNSGANTLQIYPTSGADLGAGTNVSTTILPGAHAAWVANDAFTWYQVDNIMRNSVLSGITASTTQTQGQGALTKDVNEISVVANANDTVTLPTAPSYSRTVLIINNGANTLKIFPASGDNLGAGVDTSTTLASGSNVRYTNYDSTNWRAI